MFWSQLDFSIICKGVPKKAVDNQKWAFRYKRLRTPCFEELF